MDSEAVEAPSGTAGDPISYKITENVHAVNSRCEDPRLKFLLQQIVTHLHDFARETRLSFREWEEGIKFLTEVGQASSATRNEYILLSDVLGLSMLVDSIDNPKPQGATEGTVLGPFHTHDAETVSHGANITYDPDGKPCLVLCTVKDMAGNPVEGVKVDIWETDSHGFYDVQRPGRTEPNGRAVLESDADGGFWFNAIVPVPYPVPDDGPVGKLLTALKRHSYRPSHMHFMLEKPGYERLVSSLFIRGDPYESSDAVFGVKESLLVDLETVNAEEGERYGVVAGSSLLKHEFILITETEATDLRERNAMQTMKDQGKRMRLYHGLPVPDVD